MAFSNKLSAKAYLGSVLVEAKRPPNRRADRSKSRIYIAKGNTRQIVVTFLQMRGCESTRVLGNRVGYFDVPRVFAEKKPAVSLDLSERP